MEEYLKITIQADPSIHEVLIAELSLIEFDSFQELDEAIDAFIPESRFNQELLIEILKRYGLPGDFEKILLQNINWNEEWEKNFEPVYINDAVQIRASFHQPKPNYAHDIIIDPKMSFGTGHHETTHLMVAEQLNLNHDGKNVLDVGTGTGILAIMAAKLGAKSITATDIDSWCIENSTENFKLNHLENFEIFQGTIDKLTLSKTYDLIYANINKNVLLKELDEYEKLLAKSGIILLSGFYEGDLNEIVQKGREIGLVPSKQNTRNNWALLSLKR